MRHVALQELRVHVLSRLMVTSAVETPTTAHSSYPDDAHRFADHFRESQVGTTSQARMVGGPS
ncbi:MAG: hypothetical protein JWN97_2456 [Nocardioides sp.]|nr:hypothetical protein [Nocardioides sp.]